MSKKSDLLKPHLLEGVARLKRFIEMDAPGEIVGAEAFHVFATTLATYGKRAGWAMIQHVQEQNLHSRGVCSHDDCIRSVDRPSLGVCASCEAKILATDSNEAET